MAKIEYLIRTNLGTDDLDELGAKGWELVSVIVVYSESLSSNTENIARTKEFYFKREVSIPYGLGGMR